MDGELSKDGVSITNVKVNNFGTPFPSAINPAAPGRPVKCHGEIIVPPNDPLEKGDYILVVFTSKIEKTRCKITITETATTKKKKVASFTGTIIQP